IWGQTDHCFQQVIIDKALADLFLCTTAEEDAMWHNRRHDAILVEYRKNMLGEHQISLVLFWTQSIRKAFFRERQLIDLVILAERRIADYAVKMLQFAIIDMCRVSQHIVIRNIGIQNTMKDHIHFTDGPDLAITILAEEL